MPFAALTKVTVVLLAVVTGIGAMAFDAGIARSESGRTAEFSPGGLMGGEDADDGPGLEKLGSRIVERRQSQIALPIGQKYGPQHKILIRIFKQPLDLRAVRMTMMDGTTRDADLLIGTDDTDAVQTLELDARGVTLRNVVLRFEPTLGLSPSRVEVFGVRRARDSVADVPFRDRRDLPDFWSQLATRQIDPQTPGHTIMLSERDVYMSRILVAAADSPIGIDEVVVIYGDGDMDRHLVRRQLREGERSDPIDVAPDRPVRGITLVYSAQQMTRETATLQLYADRRQRYAPERNYEPMPQVKRHWVKLGERRAELFVKDRDLIRVSRQTGLVSSVKLTAKRHDIRVYRVRIHFADGTSETIPFRGKIEDGYSTQPFKLQNQGVPIQRITIQHKTKFNLKGPGRLQLWGLQTPPVAASAVYE